ncbi:hypothetical protein KY330_00060 [Candidatus Woesearchaeota archaeon]|nr:hypothetical protein [Candidatus Woesearchaeota archaeon]
MKVDIKGNRKDDLLEDALSDSFFEFREKKKPEKKTVEDDVLLYKKVEWETYTPRSGGLVHKTKLAFRFDRHSKRLKQHGWSRAPSVQEYVSLIVDYEFARLEQKLRHVVDDMEGWEFTSTLVSYEPGLLTFIEGVYDTYNFDGMNNVLPYTSSAKGREFDIYGVDSGETVYLSVLAKKFPELYNYLYPVQLPAAVMANVPYFEFPKNENHNYLLVINKHCSIKPANEAYSRGVKVK